MVDSILGLLVSADWRLVRLTFRLQGKAVEQLSTLHFTNSIGEAEALVFSILRQGHEITAARLRLQAISIYFHLQAVKGAVGLHVVERKFEQINRLRRLGQRFESGFQVVAIVDESAASAIGKVRQ